MWALPTFLCVQKCGTLWEPTWPTAALLTYLLLLLKATFSPSLVTHVLLGILSVLIHVGGQIWWLSQHYYNMMTLKTCSWSKSGVVEPWELCSVRIKSDFYFLQETILTGKEEGKRRWTCKTILPGSNLLENHKSHWGYRFLCSYNLVFKSWSKMCFSSAYMRTNICLNGWILKPHAQMQTMTW